MPSLSVTVQNRRDTAANWTSANPVLADGELGIETDGSGQFKIGDGATAWNSLPYSVGMGSQGPAGPAGAMGATGPSGATGPQGPEGPAGADSTVPGPAGPQGNPGAAGSDGVDGVGWTGGSYNPSTGIVTFTSDDSLGFSTGDLRGANGADGAAGPQGDTGPQGIQGLQGAPGNDGAAGPQGDAGPAGADGTNVTITIAADQTAFDNATPGATELVVLYA